MLLYLTVLNAAFFFWAAFWPISKSITTGREYGEALAKRYYTIIFSAGFSWVLILIRLFL